MSQIVLRQVEGVPGSESHLNVISVTFLPRRVEVLAHPLSLQPKEFGVS